MTTQPRSRRRIRRTQKAMLPPALCPRIEALARRRLALPGLLFIAGHRPLAFVIGQLLFMAQPLAWLFPALAVEDWARLLSHPQGPALLERSLATLVHSQNEPPVNS